MKVYAHRGSSLLWPENTMLAFDRAHQAGADAFETDLRLSRDETVILSHDDNLVRFGRADVTVSQMNADELSRVDIPSPDGTFRDHLISLRTLLQAYPDKDYIFDCKISDRRLFVRLRDLLTELKFQRSVWFLTWSRRADGYVREFFPDCPYFPREFRTRVWGWARFLGLGDLLEPKNRILSLPAFHWNRPLFDHAMIESLRRRNKTFVGYLVNDERAYRHCVACGVDTVLTDRPELIRTLSQAKRVAQSG